MSPPLTAAAVEAALAELLDPESGRTLASTGQIQDLRVDPPRVSLTVALTSHAAPLRRDVQERVEEALRRRFPEAQLAVRLGDFHRPPTKLGEIGLTAKSVIAVGSGKGGVGKSTIAAALALGLARAGCKTGLCDADVYGPSIPHLFGLEGRPAMVGGKIQPLVAAGLPIVSMGFFVPKEQAVVWRGPMLHQAVTQMLRDSAWGELDYLIIDMPPGTGDVALTLSQLLPLTGAVVVCTPQDVALLDAVKAISMFRTVKIPVLGMVENMSGFVCPSCGVRHEIFGSGGARKRAEDLEVPFLGEAPLNMAIRLRGDEGRAPAMFDDPQVAPYLDKICLALARRVAEEAAFDPPGASLPVLL